MKPMYIYIMTNKNHTTLYVGMTNNLVRRVEQHKKDIQDGFSCRYTLHKLVYYEYDENLEGCILREKYLKKCYRKTKEKIITNFNPEWEDLSKQIKTFG